MRVTSVSCFFLVALVGCGHVGSSGKPSAPGTPGQNGDFEVVFAKELAGRKGNVVAAWVAYGIAKSATLQGKMKSMTATIPSDYVMELGARKAMVEVWRELQAKAGERDTYLDKLSEVEKAGFLQEYVIFYFASSGWNVPQSALAQVDWNGFVRYAKANLQGHRGETWVEVVKKGAPAQASPPGSSLPRAQDLMPLNVPCAQSLQQIVPALSQWHDIETELPGSALALPADSSRLPTLEWLFSHSGQYPNGVTFVPGNIPQLFFLRGYCSVDTRDMAQAEQSLRKAAALAPLDGRIHLELVTALAAQKKLLDAQAEAELGLQYAVGKCQTGLAWRKRGFVLFELGKLADSYTAYQKSLDYDPSSKMALSELLLLAKEIDRNGMRPPANKPYVPPPASEITTTRCHEE